MRWISAILVASLAGVLAGTPRSNAKAPVAPVAPSVQGPCSIIATLKAALAAYGNNVSTLRVERLSVIGKWAFVEFEWGDGGGDALLESDGAAWRLIRAGGGQMPEPILVAFGVDPATAHQLPLTQKPPPNCNQTPPPPSPSPSPSPTPTPTPTPTPKPTAPPTPTSISAPLDRKFGPVPLSPLEISNRIGCLDQRADAGAHPDVGAWPSYLQGAIRDIEHRFPHDPGLPGWIYAMEIFYDKMHASNEADQMHRWLSTTYATSVEARRTASQIDSDIRKATPCYMPANSFTAPPNAPAAQP